MAVFTLNSSGVSDNTATATAAAVAAAGDDVIFVNDSGADVTVTISSAVNAGLSAVVHYPEDTSTSTKEDTGIGRGDSFRIGAKSYVRLVVANSTASSHNLDIAINGIRTAHETSAHDGQQIFSNSA